MRQGRRGRVPGQGRRWELRHPQGEAEAMRITREALQNMPDAYIQQMWIEKWNGELPAVQAGDSASVIVNPGLKDAGQ